MNTEINSLLDHPSAPPTPSSQLSSNPLIQLPAPAETDPQAFQRLAGLSPAEYDRARTAAAEQLGIRIRTLDAEVAQCRTELDLQAQADALHLPLLEPWPEPVDGPPLLAQVSSRYTLYSLLPPGAADAITLWTTYSHAFAAFHLSPRLNLSSPESGCGKTTVLEVIATMVPRPLTVESLTPAVLFRLVHQFQPTLLLDEVDAYLPRSEELRGLLNAGHKRGGCAYRCEGPRNAARAFNAFAPAALAGIGPLPATLRNRSVIIPLTEAQEGQLTTRFDPSDTQIEQELARKLARWAKDHFPALAACKPPLPPGAFNRLADNWRPLFAIAQIAGGDWPTRALAAFAHLSAKPTASLPEPKLLLADSRAAFAQAGTERLFSATLVRALQALPARPWSGDRTHRPLTEKALSCQLASLGIRSQPLRIGADRARGYVLADFLSTPATQAPPPDYEV